MSWYEGEDGSQNMYNDCKRGKYGEGRYALLIPFRVFVCSASWWGMMYEVAVSQETVASRMAIRESLMTLTQFGRDPLCCSCAANPLA